MPLLRQRGAKHRKIPIFQDSLDKKSLEERRLANEEAYDWDCGEGRSSRAHSLPDGHHNDELYGVRAHCALRSAANHRGQSPSAISRTDGTVPMIHPERRKRREDWQMSALFLHNGDYVLKTINCPRDYFTPLMILMLPINTNNYQIQAQIYT